MRGVRGCGRAAWAATCQVEWGGNPFHAPARHTCAGSPTWDMVFGRMSEFQVDELMDAVEEKEGTEAPVAMDEEAAGAADAEDSQQVCSRGGFLSPAHTRTHHLHPACLHDHISHSANVPFSCFILIQYPHFSHFPLPASPQSASSSMSIISS